MTLPLRNRLRGTEHLDAKVDIEIDRRPAQATRAPRGARRHVRGRRTPVRCALLGAGASASALWTTVDEWADIERWRPIDGRRTALLACRFVSCALAIALARRRAGQLHDPHRHHRRPHCLRRTRHRHRLTELRDVGLRSGRAPVCHRSRYHIVGLWGGRPHCRAMLQRQHHRSADNFGDKHHLSRHETVDRQRRSIDYGDDRQHRSINYGDDRQHRSINYGDARQRRSINYGDARERRSTRPAESGERCSNAENNPATGERGSADASDAGQQQLVDTGRYCSSCDPDDRQQRAADDIGSHPRGDLRRRSVRGGEDGLW